MKSVCCSSVLVFFLVKAGVAFVTPRFGAVTPLPVGFASELSTAATAYRTTLFAKPLEGGPKNKSRRTPAKRTSKKKGAKKLAVGSNGADANAKTEVKAENVPLQKTLTGGPSLIFDMARRMLVWDEDNMNDSSTSQQQQQPAKKRTRIVLPRWHPHSGISDVNPSFRSSPPVMNNAGYAGVIRRNSRKRGKPGMWRHSLRMYQTMRTSELQLAQNATTTQSRRRLIIQRSNIHFEGALVSCSKLGLWKKAMQIYHEVEEKAVRNGDLEDGRAEIRQQRSRGKFYVAVTDTMVQSLVSACAKASRRKRRQTGDSRDGPLFTIDERREPLDAVRQVLFEMEKRHGIPLVARHLNPLAAAYQHLGFVSEASELLSNLPDPKRISLEPPFEHKEKKKNYRYGNGDVILQGSPDKDDDIAGSVNVNNLYSKDRASYSILVQGAVADEDWTAAIDSLRTMTESSLYPKGRNLNAWTEVSKSNAGKRGSSSWKKKRDECWLDSLR